MLFNLSGCSMVSLNWWNYSLLFVLLLLEHNLLSLSLFIGSEGILKHGLGSASSEIWLPIVVSGSCHESTKLLSRISILISILNAERLKMLLLSGLVLPTVYNRTILLPCCEQDQLLFSFKKPIMQFLILVLEQYHLLWLIIQVLDQNVLGFGIVWTRFTLSDMDNLCETVLRSLSNIESRATHLICLLI